MHKRFVINLVSRLVMFVSIIMLVPLAWATHDDPYSKEAMAFIISILLGMLSSIFFRLRYPVKKIDYDRVNAKDGLAIVGISWIVVSAFGALPLYLSNVVGSYTDAFFEIASGFTTTGASIFSDVEALPRGILLWRSMTQWLGGMGIIVLYLALLPAFSQNAFQLYKAEAPGIAVERAEPRIKETAKRLWSVYFILSFLQLVLLTMGGMPVFDAICHTFTTMATGGFSTKNASIAAYSPYIQWVIIVFMFLAGTNFILHYYALRSGIRRYWRSEEFRFYLGLVVLAVAFFTIKLSATALSASPFRDATFQVVSILTTTGFTSADFDAWPHALRFTLVMLMFIGGCGGSTGGGMKVVRFFVAVKVGIRSVVQAIFPHAVVPIKFERNPLHDKLIMGILSYFIIFTLLFFFGTIIFVITERCDLDTAYSASIAALSNIGPGLGQVGATQNYAWVSIPGKWLLTFLMLAGRLELYSILILFLPATWKK